jgi:hypothetical protein
MPEDQVLFGVRLQAGLRGVQIDVFAPGAETALKNFEKVLDAVDTYSAAVKRVKDKD